MLDNITKKNIDDCRDVLVGKVTTPSAQIEQITYALIYKFMDDMDKEAVEKYKGKAKFFTGEFSKYGWRKLFDPSLSGKDMNDLYREALEKLQTNPNIPEFFRSIFKNAELPYRDPATLKMFLKHINEFEYSHSEKLGDAFEYLLSVMGSQGDAGQFRTPRHIIDFIAACLNPQKNETVADPACGTAGFLLSAYKHILKQNTDKRLGDKLTPDQRKKLAENFVGYDISPDMVRLSLVNMYLHGFTTPHIFEYDTLSSEDRWEETFDVILANPPFMTPKGGIRPHKKFGVQANKAEVLFTDYIAEHLNKNGRAGIVVPNGIVATTQTAYKQLRKLLVDDGLIAVVSLPSGCFQPYSGVKTSVLMLDKSLVKKSNHILFIKIANDGFDLGAQRREHDKNDLPLALEAFNAYKESISSGKAFDEEKYKSICTLVEKEKILENKDVVLSEDRYFEKEVHQTEFSIIKLNEITIKITDGSHNIPKEVGQGKMMLSSKNVKDGKISFEDVRYISDEDFERENKRTDVNVGDVLMTIVGTIGRTVVVNQSHPKFTLQRSVSVIKPKLDIVNSVFLASMLNSEPVKKHLLENATGVAQKGLYLNQVKEIEIPLPPLEIQEQIVKEIEGYQKIIDGAKMVVDNYKPTISIKPEWEMVELGGLYKNLDGKRKPVTKSDRTKGIYPYYGASGIVDYVEDFIYDEELLLVSEDGANLLARSTPIAFSVNGKIWVNNHAHVLKFENRDTQRYIEIYLNSIDISMYVTGAAQPKLNQQSLNRISIPLPSIEEQSEIVKQIDMQQQLVSANKQLITIFEQKIKDKINEVWGVKEEN
jgi:type I restriction enzyme M protein